MKKLLSLLLVAALMLSMVACSSTPAATEEAPAAEAPAEEAPAEEAPAEEAPAEEAPASDLTFAIVPKSAGNPYNEREASGFEEACADGIAVAANDAEALESTLQAARDSGIVVVTLDSDAKGSQLFVNQAGVTEVGQVLVDSIYDMTGGEGQFAVLSATSTATNQNSWIAAMEQIIAGDAKYENLEWVVTVYGDDESQKSYDETESLMTNYPDLKVICCPTTVGILACAQAVQNSGSAIKVAGLGLPSEMNGYVGEGLPCPYMYLWNPIDVGACAAYAIQAFIDGATTGAVGETYTAGNGSTYEVIEKDESVGVYTPQVIVGPPFEFTADNIAEWAEVY